MSSRLVSSRFGSQIRLREYELHISLCLSRSGGAGRGCCVVTPSRRTGHSRARVAVPPSPTLSPPTGSATDPTADPTDRRRLDASPCGLGLAPEPYSLWGDAGGAEASRKPDWTGLEETEGVVPAISVPVVLLARLPGLPEPPRVRVDHSGARVKVIGLEFAHTESSGVRRLPVQTGVVPRADHCVGSVAGSHHGNAVIRYCHTLRCRI